ncbi:MAG: DUF167 domain-containing protein [Candidatus Omnitrophota bacterium]
MPKTVRIKVITRSKKRSVEPFADGLKVRLAAAPVGGKANRALIEILAEYYGVRKSAVRIAKGALSKEKTVVVDI